MVTHSMVIYFHFLLISDFSVTNYGFCSMPILEGDQNVGASSKINGRGEQPELLVSNSQAADEGARV